MPLSDIEAHCEKDEARTDGAHAKMDKLSDGGSDDGSTEGALLRPGPKAPVGKIIVVVVVAIVAVAAALFYYLTMPTMNLAPVMVNEVFVNSQNGMRVWANASDPDDAIYTITVEIYVNSTPLGDPVLVEVYYINQSTANVSDVISLGTLPAGDYLIRAYAVDVLEKESEFQGFYSFSLPV